MRISTFAFLTTVFLVSATTPCAGLEAHLDDYLPAGTTYDPAIPTPSDILGFEVGEWHVRHDQLVAYMEALAAASDRVRIEETGRTYERRRLLLLTISSPANLGQVEELRRRHLNLADPRSPRPDLEGQPLVLYMGYSVHGNEASGSNAALLVAYHLAAGRGPAVETLLDEAVILLDPCLNPDGLARFAQWANSHRGRVPAADPNHREHREGWPSGRTNHYWFDLNRDWLLLQHPESRARVAQFHRWRPHVLTDFHEMGSGSTYFFQPGVPSRQNPLTPEKNLELTHRLAAFHARALDRAGRLYYTEETFDDFYYGKGSTYPDIHGAIGILFEQASARGHRQNTAGGELTFPRSIHNQFLTSLSTFEGALANRDELIAYQADFYRDAFEEAAATGSRAAYVFGDGHDRARTLRMLEVLLGHSIRVAPLVREVTIGDETFRPGEAYAVPLRQPQYRLIEALFERRLEFQDSTFYDVSTWTLPLAFALPYHRGDLAPEVLGPALDGPPQLQTTADLRPAVAHAFSWDGYYAPRALYRLQKEGVRTRVTTRPMTLPTADGERQLAAGGILVPTADQPVAPERLRELLHSVAERDAIDVLAVTSGLTPSGIDLGSPSVRPLAKIRPALLVGGGVATYEAGQAWHLLDHRFEIELPLLDITQLGDIDLKPYSHLLLVDGDYGRLASGPEQALRSWVQGGGILIAVKRAALWADRKIREQPEAAPEEQVPPEETTFESWGEREAKRARGLISGTIFEVELDTTHPLAFGYRRERLPVFRNSTVFLPHESRPYRAIARYTAEPLLSGFVSQENLERLQGTPAVTWHSVGKGGVVRLADDPNFRAIWYGTTKLFVNPLFFGKLLSRDGRRD